MRVMGIDPGTICCGYGIVEFGEMGNRRDGVVEKCKIDPTLQTSNTPKLQNSSHPLVYITSGEIRMNQKDPLPQRLKILYDSLKGTLDEYSPSHLCIEKIFYHKSIRSAMTLGSTRGIAMLLAAQKAIPLFEYNSTELKMALTGYGRAEKRQVREMVIRILNINPSKVSITEDSGDALALCICHINNYAGYGNLNSKS